MNPKPPESPLSLDDRIDLACDRFEKQWHSEEPIAVAELLLEFSETERDAALRELLAVELELRFKQGEPLEKEEYLSRWPQYDSVVSELFSTDVDQMMMTTPPVASDGPMPSTRESISDKKPQPAIPEMIGKYRIVAALDRGGQATVYRAIHPELGRDVVIKFCHVEKSNDPETDEALRSEGRVLANLEHPNLARVYDFDFHENRAYLVMEFVRGLNLAQFKKQTSPTPDTWIPLVRQVAEALDYVHSQGVLHLDIKPQNILIDDAGTPRLIDFGLARTDAGWDQSGSDPERLSGTLAFMAPEQAACDAETIGPRSDVFGLGGVLFYLVTGKPPLMGKNVTEAIDNAKRGKWNRQLLTQENSDASIRQIIESAFATNIDERTKSADELARQLAALEKKTGWSTWTKIAAAALLAVGLLLAIMFVFPRSQPVDLPEPTIGEMKVRVWRAGNTFDLTDSAPVGDGDRIEIRTQVPVGVNVSLFLFDSEGKLSLVESVPAANSAYEYRYPKDRSQFEQIVGQPGTEFVFLCGNRDRPVTVDELLGLGLFTDAWPQLPDDSVIRIRTDGVEFLQRGRGFGGGVETADPQQQVFDYLRQLRTKLEPISEFVEGIAFAHVE